MHISVDIGIIYANHAAGMPYSAHTPGFEFGDRIPQGNTFMHAVERPLVAVIMGSKSDWETMRHAAAILSQFEVPHECRVVSALAQWDWGTQCYPAPT